MTEQKHIPVPYTVEPINSGETYQITTCEDKGFVIIAETSVDLIDGKVQADFIVRACNAHDDLVAAVEYALRHIEGDGAILEPEEAAQCMRAALAKTKGVTSA